MNSRPQWRPIETAPEETSVLIWDGKMICAAHRWKTIGNKSFWSCDGADGYECENMFDNPTHWMPLPEPPK